MFQSRAGKVSFHTPPCRYSFRHRRFAAARPPARSAHTRNLPLCRLALTEPAGDRAAGRRHAGPDAGIALLAATLVRNRAALSRHEALVEQVACEMVRSGRVTWRGLGLRARLPALEEGGAPRWCIAKPDVFSIRHTSVHEYVDPIVHEIKVHRSDLLGDLRRPETRAAYLDPGGECCYVLGSDAKGRPIGAASEVPASDGLTTTSASLSS